MSRALFEAEGEVTRDGAKPAAATAAPPGPSGAPKRRHETVEKYQRDEEGGTTHRSPGPEMRIQGAVAAPVDAEQDDRVHDGGSMGIPSSKRAQD